MVLGVWERVINPSELFGTLAQAGVPILCSYSPVELTPPSARRKLGWVNDLSLEEFSGLASEHGYRPSVTRQVDKHQYLIRFERATAHPDISIKRVHVLSCNNVYNFGDRLGFHLINETLPPNAEVSWGTLDPLAPVPGGVDLLVVGIGNSLIPSLVVTPLLEATAQARASIGIFGTQYREACPAGWLDPLVERLTHWYARNEEDVLLYARARSNVTHLGDWLINAFSLAASSNDRTLHIGKEIWQNDLPLDRTIQRIQSYRRVISDRIHPLLCALTSAEAAGYREQRESNIPQLMSGKFRSMLMDVFGQTFPEGQLWPVDRDKVVRYKQHVRRNTDELRERIRKLLQ